MDFKKKKKDGVIFALLIVIVISGALILGRDKIFTSEADNNIHLEDESNVVTEGETEKASDNSEELEKLLNIKNNSLMMLVNRNNTLSSDYVPDELVLSEIDFVSYIETR